MTSPDPNPSPRRKIVPTVLVIALIAVLVWSLFPSTYHLATVREGILYRDGARSVRELEKAIREVKPRTVVCLVDDQEMGDPRKPQFKEEFAYLKNHGIRAERIAVKLGGWPSAQDVQQFLKIVVDPANQPVLVHCAQGVRRTGMMVAAYQESVLGYDKNRAKAQIKTFGHSDKTINDIRHFIDTYNPNTQLPPPRHPTTDNHAQPSLHNPQPTTNHQQPTTNH